MKHIIYVERITLDYSKFSHIEIIMLSLSFVGYPSKKRQAEVTLLICKNNLHERKSIYDSVYPFTVFK